MAVITVRSSKFKVGFTFVELLIAATMMSILFVGLGTHLRGGISVWQRATTTVDHLQQQRVAFDQLERDLANAFIYDENADHYGEAEGQLPAPFFRSDAMRWYTVSAATTQHPATVQVVTYTCESRGGAFALWRDRWSIPEARQPSLRPATADLVLSGCTQLSLKYAYRPEEPSNPLDWNAPWPRESTEEAERLKKLPRLILVSLTVSDVTVQRVCAIPIGILEPFRASEGS